uniref:Uncharacterized protein n=1 Tax=Hucho hucho TaxID=62062 RepID=A0A4W5LDC7_9TELE
CSPFQPCVGLQSWRSDKCMQAIRDDIELKYKETLRENRRETVHLEKDKDRVQGYRQAIASQSQQLMEECRRLSQEQESLTGEKNPLLQTGGARALFHMALEREREEVKEGLVERQEAFYSILVPWEKRLEMEKDVLVRAGREQALTQLDLRYWQLQVTLQKHRRAEATLLETQSSNL